MKKMTIAEAYVLAFSTFEHYMKILEMYFVYKNVKTRKKL